MKYKATFEVEVFFKADDELDVENMIAELIIEGPGNPAIAGLQGYKFNNQSIKIEEINESKV